MFPAIGADPLNIDKESKVLSQEIQIWITFKIWKKKKIDLK